MSILSQRPLRNMVVGGFVALLLMAGGSARASVYDCPVPSFLENQPYQTQSWEVWSNYYAEEYKKRNIWILAKKRSEIHSAYNQCYLVKVAGFTRDQAVILMTVFAEDHELRAVDSGIWERMREHEAREH